jgi:hypothetical protein
LEERRENKDEATRNEKKDDAPGAARPRASRSLALSLSFGLSAYALSLRREFIDGIAKKTWSGGFLATLWFAPPLPPPFSQNNFDAQRVFFFAQLFRTTKTNPPQPLHDLATF